MLQILCTFLTFYVLGSYGIPHQLCVDECCSISDEICVDAMGCADIDIVDCGSCGVCDDCLLDVGSAICDNVDVCLDAGYAIDAMGSAVTEVSAMASACFDYTSIIDADLFLSASEKASYLSYLGGFSSYQLEMVTDLLGMLSGATMSHLQFKLSVIKAAKGHLSAAMEAIAIGEMDVVSEHILAVVSDLQDCCPICSCLKYALESDMDILPFVCEFSSSILSRIEMDLSEEICIDGICEEICEDICIDDCCC